MLTTATEACTADYKFTGKERDSESNLDNFGARYFASTTGRFMTPDWALKPLAVPYANFGDPQTLNLYTYVENSPLNRIDADGHFGIDWSGGRPHANDASADSRDGGEPTGENHTSDSDSGPEKNQAQDQGQAQAPQQDPVTATNTAAQAILSQQNACSTYFNAGARIFSAGTQTSAASFLASDNVQSVNNSTFTTVGGTSTQGTGQGSTITMNLNSPFMLPVRPQNDGPPMIYRVGSFVSASPQGKVGMLFHELAHTLNMIPRDGGNRDQSFRNTQTIMEHCETAIRHYFQ